MPEQSFEMVWAAKWRTMLDVWTAWTATLLNSDCNGQFMTWIQAMGDRYFLTDAACLAQTSLIDFLVRKNASPRHFLEKWRQIRRALFLKQFQPCCILSSNISVRNGWISNVGNCNYFLAQRFCWTPVSVTSWCWVSWPRQFALSCLSVIKRTKPSRFCFVCVSAEPKNCKRKLRAERAYARRKCRSFSENSWRLAASNFHISHGCR